MENVSCFYSSLLQTEMKSFGKLIIMQIEFSSFLQLSDQSPMFQLGADIWFKLRFSLTL